MRLCFVAQPFRKPYLDLYDDVFDPAITKAGFAPYRADNNPAVTSIFGEIENKICESRIVLAEITEDNPNVWFELGYAVAIGKPYCVVCRKERKGKVRKIPVNLQGKLIIFYTDNSAQSWKKLRKDIASKLDGVFQKAKFDQITRWKPSELKGGRDGLDGTGAVALALLSDYQDDYPRGINRDGLWDEMDEVGYGKLGEAAEENVISALLKGDLVAEEAHDDDEEPFINLVLSQKGLEWARNNVPDWGQKAQSVGSAS